MPRGKFAPDLNPDESKSTLVATVPHIWQCALDDIADAEGMSRSQIIREAIREYLEKKGKVGEDGEVCSDRFDPYGWKAFV